MDTTTKSAQQTGNDGSSWMIALGLVLLSLLGLRKIGHADFWTHLAAGRWIAENGIPRTDPLTLFSQGEAWVNGSWLYDRIIFQLWQIGNAPLLVLLHTAIVLVAFLLLLRVARPYASPLTLGWALLLSAWLLAPRFDVRPGIMGLLFASAFLNLLSIPGRPAWMPFAILLPLQILWANMDASFIWGPVVALVFCAQSLATRSNQLKPHLLLLVALLIVPLINPYGTAIYGAMAASWAAPVFRDWISPIAANMNSSFTSHLITLSLIIGAGGLLTCRSRLPIALTAMAVLTAFLVVRSTPTHVDFFAVFAFPFLALSLQSIVDFLRDRIFSGIRSAQQSITRIVSVLAIVLFLVSAVAILTNRYYVRVGSFSSFGLTAQAAPYPDRALDVLSHPEFPERVINLPLDGGYLAWSSSATKPFIDQRAELHGADIYTLLAQGMIGRTSEWDRVMSTWQPEAVIVNNAWPYSGDVVNHLQAAAGWKTVYFDGGTTIFVLDDDSRAGLIAATDEYLADGLQHIETVRRTYRQSLGGIRKPAFPAELLGAATVFQSRGFFREAAACYSLTAQGAPHLYLARLNLGVCQTRLEAYAEASSTLEDVLPHLPAGSPAYLSARLHLGMCQVQLGRHSQALRHLNAVTAAAPGNPLGWLWLSRAYQGLGQTADARQAIERARAIDPNLTQAFISSR